MHLQRLEAAGLIVGVLELSEDGKAMKYFEVADFDLHLSAATLAAAANVDPHRPRETPRRGGAPLMSWSETILILDLLFAVLVLVGFGAASWLDYRNSRRTSRRTRISGSS
jgi:hypothetical protein